MFPSDGLSSRSHPEQGVGLGVRTSQGGKPGTILRKSYRSWWKEHTRLPHAAAVGDGADRGAGAGGSQTPQTVLQRAAGRFKDISRL